MQLTSRIGRSGCGVGGGVAGVGTAFRPIGLGRGTRGLAVVGGLALVFGLGFAGRGTGIGHVGSFKAHGRRSGNASETWTAPAQKRFTMPGHPVETADAL